MKLVSISQTLVGSQNFWFIKINCLRLDVSSTKLKITLRGFRQCRKMFFNMLFMWWYKKASWPSLMTTNSTNVLFITQTHQLINDQGMLYQKLQCFQRICIYEFDSLLHTHWKYISDILIMKSFYLALRRIICWGLKRLLQTTWLQGHTSWEYFHFLIMFYIFIKI